MRLAEDEIVIRVAGGETRLRPTLRAAMRLEGRYGFEKLFRAVSEGNLTVVSEIIAETATAPSSLPDFLAKIASMPLRVGLEAVTGPVLNLVCALAGIDPDKPETDNSNAEAGERITFAEYHARLYRIGTGALGWTPEVTWNATPAEIIEAYKGRAEFIRAIFGGTPDQDSEPGPKIHSAAEVATSLSELKMMTAGGGNRAA